MRLLTWSIAIRLEYTGMCVPFLVNEVLEEGATANKIALFQDCMLTSM